MPRVAISVENVSKMYRLGEINTGTFYGDLKHWWKQKLGLSTPVPMVEDGRRFDQKNGMLWALKDVSFTVNEGEMIGIIGENGAGKSTLLKILSKVTAPTSGEIRARGRIASLLEVGTGFHPELTGRENIFLNGAILGMDKRTMQSKFDEIVDFSGVEKFIDSPVKHYSSGMFVRLAFSVAAHLEPDILILDEVFAVGDAAFQKKSLNKMNSIAQSGRTIIYVSHSMGSVKQLCANAILLDAGRILLQGHSADVTSYYLSKSLPNEGAAKARKELAADIDKPVQIRSVAVLDRHGNSVDFLDLNEEFIVQIDYEIRESLDSVSIGCQIIADENQVTVISLSDPELDSKRLNEREVGYYRSTIVIPGRILNVGSYWVRVGASRLSTTVNSATILDLVDNVSFRVMDRIGITQHLGFERKNSILAMQLPWEVERFETQPNAPCK